ncbi:hypothetical protein Q8A73_002400 [Channa argus]|nr:hypothetical protein Q8A73_002400 [Channa argus]
MDGQRREQDLIKQPNEFVALFEGCFLNGGLSAAKQKPPLLSLICLGRVPLGGGSTWTERALPEDYRMRGAVKMDASQRREEPCSVPIALHCRKLITTLPSKNHSRPRLPHSHQSPEPKSASTPASAQDPAPASMTDRTS